MVTLSISTLTSIGIVVKESHLTSSLFCTRNACSAFAGKAYIKRLATKCHQGFLQLPSYT